MKVLHLAVILGAVLAAGNVFGQRLASPVIGSDRVPDNILLRLVKAEDERNDQPAIELLGNVNNAVRYRAALAAGRIGSERAAAPLAGLLNDSSIQVREMAAFALGEIESLRSADVVLKALQDKQTPDPVRARLIEAAGKIAAANAGQANAPVDQRDRKVIELGNAILDVLDAEEARREKQYKPTVLFGLTATLRARPEGADIVVAGFLTNLDGRLRADAANTLARLRAKNANLALRAMLMNDDDPIARANAARALGSAEDKEAVNILVEAAAGDEDSRVRVSAIRSLALLRDPYAVEKMLQHGEKLLTAFNSRKRDAAPARPEKSELLEIATTLGRLIPKTNDARTVKFLTNLGHADLYRSPETEIAFARVAPRSYAEYLRSKKDDIKSKLPAVNASLQGIREFASLGTTDEEIELKSHALEQLRRELANYLAGESAPSEYSVPDILRAYAAFNPDGFDDELRKLLKDRNVFIRATAASLLADRPGNSETLEALRSAFTGSLVTDKVENDAQLGLLDAMFKLDKKASATTLLIALNSPDFLVRKKAFEMLGDPELRKEFPNINSSLEDARQERRDQVRPYLPSSGTKLGQVLNTDADYRRALARKNGTVRAVFTTQKGAFTIDLLPEDAPLTVDNFVKLARSGYFNGLEVHRVVPNFVIQDGDPLGNGSGGPGWSIRCEINMVPYGRGAVGMALSGKDTGGSQWFVTHSPQPHLDGGYTVFGKVNETGMKVVDKIVRGDKILNVRIVGGARTR